MSYTQTQITRLGLAAGPDMTNRKPYRTKEQRRLAKKMARKDKDGAWRSAAPKSYHPDSGRKEA